MIDDDTLPGFTLEETDIVEGIIEPKRSSPVFIDDLPDAVVDGVTQFKEGDLIVVEKWLTIGAKHRWLGTSLCRVRRIDPLGSGDLTLHDEELSQAVHANYITGPKRGWRFKLGHDKMNLHQRAKAGYEAGARARENPQNVQSGGHEGRRRKWRPKAVRDAEKKRIKEERAARKAARAARKAERS